MRRCHGNHIKVRSTLQSRTLTIRSKDGFSFSVPVLTYTKDGSNSTHVPETGSRKKSSFDRDLRSNFFLTSVSSIGFLSFDRELRSETRPSIVNCDRHPVLRSCSTIGLYYFDRVLRSTFRPSIDKSSLDRRLPFFF